MHGECKRARILERTKTVGKVIRSEFVERNCIVSTTESTARPTGTIQQELFCVPLFWSVAREREREAGVVFVSCAVFVLCVYCPSCGAYMCGRFRAFLCARVMRLDAINVMHVAMVCGWHALVASSEVFMLCVVLRNFGITALL